MTPVIPEPQLRNPLIRLGVAVSERIIGRRLATARLLAWSPKVAAGAGALEALAPTAGRDLPERTLRLARLTASLTLNCPFCIDMNAHRHRQVGITDAEVYALRDRREDVTKSFSPSERLVIAYARGCRRPRSPWTTRCDR
ncbi:carboxymuconolactone decarboxylase family protein [Raineyella fluvialis]|nr:carboxymuconolactone decarboxylase family protein [Raineyella fluvialis]